MGHDAEIINELVSRTDEMLNQINLLAQKGTCPVNPPIVLNTSLTQKTPKDLFTGLSEDVEKMRIFSTAIYRLLVKTQKNQMQSLDESYRGYLTPLKGADKHDLQFARDGLLKQWNSVVLYWERRSKKGKLASLSKTEFNSLPIERPFKDIIQNMSSFRQNFRRQAA